MGQSGWVHVDVAEIKRETDKAFLVSFADPDIEDTWIPKSQVSDPDDYAQGDKDVTISISEFIAREKGLG